MLSITTKAILLVLTHTILLDNTITIPTTNIQLTAPLDVGLISISQNSPFTNIELIS